MKSKKFVLAGLALLAITGLLALAGCKNDSVPETPAAKLVSITVTTLPAQTVYSVGQEFDSTGMKVTATYDDKSQREVTGWETNFDEVAAGKGLDKEVTVSYTEGDTPKTTTFTVTVFPKEVKVLTGYTSSHAPEGEWTYVEFGEWPQTIKEESVEIGAETLVRGGLTYYLGDDSNYYVKHSDKYYKVEPIVWRVLTTSYKAPEGGTAGNALLLAESILTGGIPYYHFDPLELGLNGEEWSGHRIIGNKEIHPNNYEHSQIRAWLNGLSYQSKESEGATQSPKDEYKNAGFLQTAFTESAQTLIADTTVDNSAASTTDAGNNLTQADGCSDTTDKIFLLSLQEATNSDYGFAAYDASGEGNTRIRVTTDYAEATGAYQGDPSEGYVGWWWLRSPYYYYEVSARVILSNGYAGSLDLVDDSYGGVVPALSISLQ